MCDVDETPLQLYHLTGTHLYLLAQYMKLKKHKVQKSRVHNFTCSVDESPLRLHHLTGTYFHPLTRCAILKKNIAKPDQIGTLVKKLDPREKLGIEKTPVQLFPRTQLFHKCPNLIWLRNIKFKNTCS